MFIRITLALVLLLASSFGYIYFTGGTGLPDSVRSKLSFIPQRSIDQAAVSVPDSLSSIKTPSLPTNASEQLQIVTERTGELSGTVGQVLGEAVKVATPAGEQSLQERAFDYGRYLYCQQVVKDYETRMSTIE